MSDAIPLPPRPNLDQYKKLARDCQDACKSGDRGAIRLWATRWLDTLARLEGTAGSSTPRDRERKAGQIEKRWFELLETTSYTDPCALTRAQFFIARAHGFASWPKFARHVREVARANSPTAAFEEAVDAIITGDSATLRKLLAEHPGLARDRSTREHRSTLLHYVSANGVEDYRQKTPPNIVEITNLIVDAGADVDAESDAYGGGCTTLGLVATSVHPEKAGVQIALMQALLGRGASFMQPSAGGNNQSIVFACLANGQPKAAKFLAGIGAPLHLVSAAGIGRVDVVRSYFDEGGALLPQTEPKAVQSALLYACGYGHRATAEFLLDHGVDPAMPNDAGETALHWANFAPHIEMVKLLLERGAPVDAVENRYHARPLDMALWTWAHADDKERRERCYEAVALLTRAGAKLDREHWRDAGEERSGMLEKIDSDPRMVAALRGE